MRFLIVLPFLLITNKLLSQHKCVRFDEHTQLAYSLNDSSLYTGICLGYYPNGKLEFKCIYDSGKIKQCNYWDKKGNLIDSTIYLINFIKYKEYHFSSKKRLESICVFYLSKKVNDSIDFYDYEEAEYYYKNGQLKRKQKYFLDEKNRYLLNEYFNNGNIKSSVIAYDKVKLITNNISRGEVVFDSILTEYSKDGRKIRETVYKNGIQIGESKSYK